MPELEHSCGPDCLQCRSALKPGQFEREIALYGVFYGAVLIRKSVAQKLAEAFLGKIIDNATDLTTPFLRGTSVNPCMVDLSKNRYRIVKVYLVDNPDSQAAINQATGRVITICEPLTDSRKPYKPEMEMK